MEVTLYADVLFLVNFTMDFLTLFAVSSLLRRKVRTLRLVLSSAVGGVYGVASCFMGGPLIIRLCINLAVSALMCHIAYEKKILPTLAAFYGGGCLLGGIMTALYSLVTTSSIDPSAFASDGSGPAGDIPLGWTAVVATVMTAAVIAGGRLLKKRREAFDVTVTVGSSKGKFTFSGICDSGNLLRDPIGGEAVIILEKSAFLSTIPDSERSFFEGGTPPDSPPRSLRVIPCDSVGGHSVLFGYLPAELLINGEPAEGVIAMGEGSFDGREALVPSVLCK